MADATPRLHDASRGDRIRNTAISTSRSFACFVWINDTCIGGCPRRSATFRLTRKKPVIMGSLLRCQWQCDPANRSPGFPERLSDFRSCREYFVSPLWAESLLAYISRWRGWCLTGSFAIPRWPISLRSLSPTWFRFCCRRSGVSPASRRWRDSLVSVPFLLSASVHRHWCHRYSAGSIFGRRQLLWCAAYRFFHILPTPSGLTVPRARKALRKKALQTLRDRRDQGYLNRLEHCAAKSLGVSRV